MAALSRPSMSLRTERRRVRTSSWLAPVRVSTCRRCASERRRPSTISSGGLDREVGGWLFLPCLMRRFSLVALLGVDAGGGVGRCAFGRA